MEFNDMYSQDSVLYYVSKNSMDLYWFDKGTYVDGYVGIDGLWEETTYGALWKSKVGSIRDGIYQIGMPIHTVLIIRAFFGVDDAHVKAYYDLDVLIRSNIPMNHVDIQTSIDIDSAYPMLQMPGGKISKFINIHSKIIKVDIWHFIIYFMHVLNESKLFDFHIT